MFAVKVPDSLENSMLCMLNSLCMSFSHSLAPESLCKTKKVPELSLCKDCLRKGRFVALVARHPDGLWIITTSMNVPKALL
eukprot:5018916-Lingulodinium_polyedra.AAC.1